MQLMQATSSAQRELDLQVKLEMIRHMMKDNDDPSAEMSVSSTR